MVVWKPSPAATYSNYIVYQILAEAGVPPGVIQFVPGPPPEIVQQAISHPSFAALHFTGSTHVFRQLWKDIAANLDKYKGYPRIVGETGNVVLSLSYVMSRLIRFSFSTGGKNFHLVHSSASIPNAIHQTIRGAFEYQGEFRGPCTYPNPCRFEDRIFKAKSALLYLDYTYRHLSGIMDSRSS